jgi:hypothetical protein
MAVVVGAAVILFDPIFQGLAISLMAGGIISMLIAPVAVPVLYYMAYARKAAASPPAPETAAQGALGEPGTTTGAG